MRKPHVELPGDKVLALVCLAATLVACEKPAPQVGEKDDTTTPMHGYKFAACLQEMQECDNPAILKIAWGAGHAYGASPEQTRETQAEELAFLVRVLGLDVEHVLEMW